VPQPTRLRLPLPTLVTCAAAGVALVLAVGLQAPATSVGFRWKPIVVERKFKPLEFEPVKVGLESGGPADDRWLSWLLLALIALALLAALRVLARWLLRRTRRAPALTVARTGADAGSPNEADAQIVRSGLAAALHVLTTETYSGNAVVRAWQGLQDAAALAGLERRPAETASEFTSRILYRSKRSAEPIAELLSLYQRVRFGHHAPSEAEVAAARASLATLVDLWQADLPERRPRKVAR
jgi:hypothetical protein